MAARQPEVHDRRILRTRRSLRQALVALILERGWEGFTVQDVCDRADVGRSTFYTHFADKEELVSGGVQDLGRHLRAQLRDRGLSVPFGFAQPLIEHAHEERSLFLAIVGEKSGHLARARFRELLLDLVRDDIAPLLPAGPPREAASVFITGGLLELLRWSLESRGGSPELAHRMFEELARPVLRGAGAALE